MKVDNRLTIILTLKGREDFTLRWLWHHNRIKFPFPIIIADGQVHHKLATILKDKDSFPNLTYTYLESADLSLTDYYKKCAHAVSTATSPYVRMADNDDFLSIPGLLQDISFLEENSDYVCSQGAIVGFGLSPLQDYGNVLGSLESLRPRYNPSYANREFSSTSASRRVLDMARAYHPVFYSVYRREQLQLILNHIVRLDFSNLQIHEHFWSLQTLALGKARSFGSHISYYRQLATSLRFSEKKDWIHKILRDNFSTDLKNMIDTLLTALKEKEGNIPPGFKEEFLSSYETHMRNWVVKNYQVKKGLRLKLAHLKGHVIKLTKVPLKRSRFLKSLLRTGLQESFAETHMAELKEIEKTLTSSELKLILDSFKNTSPNHELQILHRRNNLA